MISRNEILFKNPRLAEMIDYHRRAEENPAGAEPDVRNMTQQKIGEMIIGGYLYSLLDAMQDVMDEKDWMKLTYDTIGNLPKALMILFMENKRQGYSQEESMEITAKTIASVLYGLAMNEHGRMLTVELGEEMPMWANYFSISVDDMPASDFLEPALEALQPGPITVGNGLAVNMSPVILAYKAATGVDLAKYGLGNLLFAAA